ncbi:restriction endonuclease subunit S [Thiolapillus sp.]|uniref:restriction endonuclease subunit S n=2 Tax=Thiolapillus sp. TaxID=2017437 RepID=UPI0025DF1100|nr:restriction endonuclease subunit S [Thiolapillus sp.]
MRSKSDKKKPLVPSLRFPEFREAGAWEVKRLGELASRITGRVGSKKLIPISISSGVGFVSQAEKFGRDISGRQYEKYIALERGQFSYNKGNSKTFPQGSIYQLQEFEDAAVPNAFYSFEFKKKYVPEFYNGYFEKNFHGHQLARFITSGARSDGLLNISAADFFSIVLPTPTNRDEQQKIAHCLSSLDEVIGLQAKKVQALKQHKKGLMQQLFPAEGETTPRLRFPEFREAGAWEVKELIKLAGRGTERNQKGKIKRVLTNSAEHGVLDQREYFDKDIAIQGNLENYFVVDQGDFVYNPRISSFAPVGPISRNDVGKGVMSPLYTVFSFRQSDTDFFAHYFNSSAWHSYMRKVGSTGARHDRMAISNSDFLAMPLSVPNPKEQQKIAHCLSSLDEVIGLESHKLDALKNLKKGLMQQLFPQDVA